MDEEEAFAFSEHLTQLAEGAVALHEMYLGLREGGFEERQALYIIAMVMLGQPTDKDEE